jgi:hypothetical protein
MKKLTSFGLILVAFALVFSACNKKSKLIAKRWKMNSMEIAGQKVSGESVEDYGFKFSEDGKYDLKGVNGDSKGTWKLSEDEGNLIITMEGKSGEKTFEIRELSEKGLTLFEESEGVPMTTTFVENTDPEE